uniref:Uncharacterized protein n=1 Tax=Arundo donax TaxID=35708 RepID=A0A0A8ZKG4_ARUDO
MEKEWVKNQVVFFFYSLFAFLFIPFLYWNNFLPGE